jgi:hypothetical protein
MAFIYNEQKGEERNEDIIVFYTRDKNSKIIPIKHYIQRGDSEQLQYYISLHMFPEYYERNFRQYLYK